MDNGRKFVVQKHTRSNQVHWDLMFESGSVLKTYRLQLPPEKLSEQINTAVKIFDHPLKFLTYEGSVNKGAGSVEIADAGTYQLLNKDESCRELQLDGRILKGKFTLRHIKNDSWEFGLAAVR